MLKVNTVCINGMGSSLVLRMSVEKAFKELGIDAKVEACDLGGFSGKKPDVVVTTRSIASSIPKREGMIIIEIKNFVDVEGIKTKIKEQMEL